jgi:hypothetical protein
MSSPLSSDIPKPYGSTEKLTRDVNRAFALPVPAFGDLSKAANDVRIRDPLPLRILSSIDRALTRMPAYQQGLLPHLPGLANIGRLRKRTNMNMAYWCADTATLDVKLKAPNGTNVTVKGKQGFDGVTSGSVRLHREYPRQYAQHG